MVVMTISRLADAAGAQVSTICYYECRGLVRPNARRSSGYRECNDDGAQDRPAQIGDKDLKSLEPGIEGMHCSGCAHAIESLLGRDPGMRSASVPHATVTRLPFCDRSRRRY
jgi:hypothetical protein